MINDETDLSARQRGLIKEGGRRKWCGFCGKIKILQDGILNLCIVSGSLEALSMGSPAFSLIQKICAFLSPLLQVTVERHVLSG